MARYEILQRFYASTEWRIFRINLILKRSYDGYVVCEKCKKNIIDQTEIHAHHKIELTPENVKDHSISLNPELVELICHDCHNKEHNRFGYTASKNVYIVYGSPLAGKKTFVRDNMQAGDIVVDMDKLFEAISMQHIYEKPSNLLANVLNIKSLLIDNIKMRYGKWYNAYIIGGYANRFTRERIADELGAELIFIEATKEECYTRLDADKDRQYRKAEWKSYIDKWFDEYS